MHIESSSRAFNWINIPSVGTIMSWRTWDSSDIRSRTIITSRTRPYTSSIYCTFWADHTSLARCRSTSICIKNNYSRFHSRFAIWSNCTFIRKSWIQSEFVYILCLCSLEAILSFKTLIFGSIQFFFVTNKSRWTRNWRFHSHPGTHWTLRTLFTKLWKFLVLIVANRAHFCFLLLRTTRAIVTFWTR